MFDSFIRNVYYAAPLVSVLFGISLAAIAIRRFAPRRPLPSTCQPMDDCWLQSVYEHVELGMNLTDPTGRYIQVNQAYCDIMGYSKAELLNGMRWQDLTHPEDLAIDASLIIQPQTQPVVAFSVEKRCFRKDGTLIWVKLHVCQIHEPPGQLKYLTSIVEDISDRKQAATALSASESTNRAIFDAFPDHVVRLRRDGTYLDPIKNTGSVKVLHKDRIVPGANLWDILPVDLAQERMAHIERALQTGELQRYEYEIDVDGEVRCEEASITACGEDEVLVVVRDISDRKRIENALRHSEATNRAILAAIPDLLLHQRRDGSYLDVVEGNNEGLVTVAPLYQPGAAIDDVLSPDLAAIRLRSIHAALETGKLQVYEHQILIDGVIYDEEIRIIAIHEDDVLVMVRDISDRKQAEIALRKQAEQERALNHVTQAIHQSLDAEVVFSTAIYELARCLGAVGAVLLEYDPERSVWRQIAGYSAQNTGANLLGLEIPATSNPIFDDLAQGRVVCLADAQYAQHQQYWHFAAQDAGAWLILPIGVQDLWGCLGVVKADDAWPESEIALAIAITQQLAIAIQRSHLYQQVQRLNMHLENQVEERTDLIRKALNFEALLKRITDKVRDSLDENQILQTAVDELGQGLGVICCNSAIYSADGLSHKITHQYSTHAPLPVGQEIPFAAAPTPEIFSQLMTGESFQFCCSIHLYNPASDVFHAVFACPLIDDQRVLGDLWLFKAATEHFTDLEMRIAQQVANQCAIALRQSRLYQAAQAQVYALERLNQLKDDFLSTVTHELRTPMANIKMATQMLEINLQHLGEVGTEGSDRVSFYLQILRDECKRETDLINDLLDLSRLDSGTEPLATQSLELQYWLPHISEVFIERIRTQQQHFVLEIVEPLPALTTDFNYLELVVSELLHNACKYTPPGETIQISAAQCPAIRANEPLSPVPHPPASFPLTDYIQISIANSGVEILPEELGHVFDKFYRVPNNDPWKHGGTGLGLALVKKRVERLQGAIAVTSANNWTTFIIRLPCRLTLALDDPLPNLSNQRFHVASTHDQ